MTLDQAIQLVKESAKKMNEKFGQVLFDEWLIVERGASDKILTFASPRGNRLIEAFNRDTRIIDELLQNHQTPGDFAFCHEGEGTRFDAFIVLGENLFLLWNRTDETTTHIVRNPNWKAAQEEFVALTEAIRKNPVIVY